MLSLNRFHKEDILQRRVQLLILFSVTLSFRIFLAYKFKSPWIISDETQYAEKARYIFQYLSFLSPTLRTDADVLSGYPLLLSIAYFFSPHKMTVTVYHIMLCINCFLASLIIFPCFFILRKFCAEKIAFLGCIIISVLPATNVYTYVIMTENLFTLLFIVSIWLLMESYETNKLLYFSLAILSIISLIFVKGTGISMIIGFFVSAIYYLLISQKYIVMSIVSRKRNFLASLSLLVLLIVGVTSAISNFSLFSEIYPILTHMDFFKNFVLSYFHGLEFLILSSYFIIFFIALILILDSFADPKLDFSPFGISWNSIAIERRIAFKSCSIYFLVSSSVLVAITSLTMYMFPLLGDSNIEWETAKWFQVYGRYIDPLVPAIFLFGIIGSDMFYNNKINISLKPALGILGAYLTILAGFLYTFPLEYYRLADTLSIQYLNVFEPVIPPMLLISFISIISFAFFCLSLSRFKFNIFLIFLIVLSIMLSLVIIKAEFRGSISHNYYYSPTDMNFTDFQSNASLIVDFEDANRDPFIFWLPRFWFNGDVMTGNVDSINHSAEEEYIMSSRIFSKPIHFLPAGFYIYKSTKELGQMSIKFDFGWCGMELWDGIPTGLMEDYAVLKINSSKKDIVNLSLSAESFFRPRTLEIYSGNEMIGMASIPTTNFINVTARVRLMNDVATIRLLVPEGCERPGDKPELEDPDSRCLSVAVRNLTLDPANLSG